VWAILGCGVAGGLIGQWLRRSTARLRYRHRPAPAAPDVTPDATPDDIDEQALPLPGARWWMPLAGALAWAGVAWRAETDWRAYLLWLPFVTIGLYLAAVDLDVCRLPDRAQLGLAAAGLLAGLAATWTEPRRWLYALGWTLGVAGLFWLIHLVGRGALGFGDVKLAATCGWLLGLSGLSAVWAGLGLSCLLALAYALVRRSKSVAFGPWLILGSLVAGLWLGV